MFTPLRICCYDVDDYSGVCQQGMGMCFMVDALQDDYLDVMQHHLFLSQWFALDLIVYALTGWLGKIDIL